MDLLLGGLAFPEGPRFRAGKLWFSDMHAGRVMTVDLSGHSEIVVEVPAMPSGLGWSSDGSLLIVSMHDRRLLRLDERGLTTVADIGSLASSHCNDMVVDAEGRAYIGNFGFDLHAKEDFAPAEIVAETFGARLTAFDIAADGDLENRRVWAQLENAAPDGICLDAEGACWVASPISNEFLRVRHGGEVLERLSCEQMAIACMLGGADGKTLFCLTAPSTDPEENRRRNDARIYRVPVDVGHAGRA